MIEVRHDSRQVSQRPPKEIPLKSEGVLDDLIVSLKIFWHTP